MNQFINKTYQGQGRTRNNAVSNASTGSHVLNYFANVGSYRNRSLQEVWQDVAKAWGENPELTLKLIFYTRMVTRKSRMFDAMVRGQGNRDESQKAFAWVAYNYPEIANANLMLFVEAGTWKDLWSENLLPYLDRQAVYETVYWGISMGDHLLVKYLPRIRSRSNTKNARHEHLNQWARGLCNFLGWTEQDYRLYKSSPKAIGHLWQRQASAGHWNSINFNTIPGIALLRMVKNRGRDRLNLLERHGLTERYETWLDSQPVVKFTGYPYQLYNAAKARMYNMKRYEKNTFDKQFEMLLEKARQETGGIQGNVWCALDTSGSMTCQIDTSGTTAMDVCISLGIYFSALNEGSFKDHVIMFDSTSRMAHLSGTFTDKMQQIRMNAMGSTNFQSVIDEIVRIRRQNPEIPVKDYPETLLVVSDLQFNPSGSNQTNYDRAMDKLAQVGLPKITIIWWQVNGRYENDFSSTISDKGTVLVSGFDGATISLLLGGNDKLGKPLSEMTPYETMLVTLDQPLLNDLNI